MLKIIEKCGLGRLISYSRSNSMATWLIVIASLGVAAIWACLCLIRHGCLESYEDLAMFDQMLWNVRTGTGMITSISGNGGLLFPHHFFAEHFSPILYLIAPFAGITSGPEFLLIIQALAVGLSAVAVAMCVQERLKLSGSGVLAAFAWLALPAIWGAVLYDFHMDAFEPLFFFLFLYAMYRKSPAAWLWAAFYVSIKEDAPLYLGVAAIAAGMLTGHKRQGILIAAASFIYFGIVYFLVIPAFSPTGAHLLSSRLVLPSETLGVADWLKETAFNHSKWRTLGWHLMQFAFLPVVGWLASLPFLGALGLAWLSSQGHQARMEMHYPFTSYPLLVFAAVEGFRRVMQWSSRFRPLRAASAIRMMHFWTVVALGIGIFIAWENGGIYMERDMMRSSSITRWVAMTPARDMLARVPSDGTVLAASLNTAAHVARREKLTLLLDAGTTSEWIVLSYYPAVDAYHPGEHMEWMDALRKPDSGYGVWSSTAEGTTVLKARHKQNTAHVRLPHPGDFYQIEGFTHAIGHSQLDSDAGNGHSWGVTARNPPGVAAIANIEGVDPGKYKFITRLKLSCGTDKDYLSISITDDKGTVRGSRNIRGTFTEYKDLAIDVDVDAKVRHLIFKCETLDRCEVSLDRLTVSPVE